MNKSIHPYVVPNSSEKKPQRNHTWDKIDH